ncbi:MAG TPA: methyl-accepting chemotaxis protein [Gemmatimonadaceae bacterium]|nr:methyl-accepting chemotaxis protein [Gemmatimonadaceae bacterium]
MPDSVAPAHSARSLRRRLLSIIAGFAVIVLALVTYAGLSVLKKTMAGDEDARIVNAASLSKQLVDRVLAERARQVDLIASVPSVIDAAKKGAEEAARQGLPNRTGKAMSDSTLAAIEKRFKATRSLQVDQGTNDYLKGLLPKLDIAEVMLTDRWGYNAVTTSPSSDFVQSDEAWWQAAWDAGISSAQATVDPAVQRTVVDLSGVIRDGGTRVGVVKVKFGLSVVDSVLAQGSVGGNALRVDLVDSSGKVIASSVPSTRFKPLSGFLTLSTQSAGTAFTYDGDSSAQRAAVEPTNGGHWRIVAHMEQSQAARAYNVARLALLAGVVIMGLGGMILLGFIGRFIERRITGPAEELAIAAEAVAGGDLSKQVSDIGADDEIGRLARATGAMINELRRLASALNESAHETNTMTAEITASSEEMAASAGQIAHTAADLSQQANMMAETIQGLAGSSENLVGIAGQLDAGAEEGVARNTRLRTLALDNRARMDESSRELSALTVDVEASAAAIEQLADASEEVRSFVTLVQKLARQSKLLALNAAMEAARAGEHGHGFAVVAEEVRRLAAMSSDAAERTERVVGGVLNGIAQSRASTERTVETVRAVRGATEEGSASFGQIERAVAEADAWTSSIRGAVTAANGLARDMRGKLDSLASGTESFAAAMEEVAASSEEQSASTEQIAAAAGTLSGAAERLSRIVANLRLDDRASGEHPRPSGPVRVPAEVTIGRMTPARSSAAIKL